MSNDDPFIRLQDFVLWVRVRRSLCEDADDAWLSEGTLEYVTQGVERFLAGKKPWLRPRGRNADLDMTWKCYCLTNFVSIDEPFLPQHIDEGGAFYVVEKSLNVSAKAVLSQTIKARKLLKTIEGQRAYEEWLTEYKDDGCLHFLIPQNHPSTIAARERRKALGLRDGYTKAGRKRG
jgi:hypothetical protein